MMKTIDILEINLQIDIGCISWQVSLTWMPQNILLGGQNLFRKWLGAVRQQTIVWATVDLGIYRHMVSLGHDERNYVIHIMDVHGFVLFIHNSKLDI